MIVSFRNISRNLLVLAGVLCLAGCATQTPVAKSYLVFPPPPDEARIQYLTSYGTENDLGPQSKWSRFLVGSERILRPIWKPYGVAIRDGKIYVADTQAINISIADLAKHRIRYIRPDGLGAMKLPINVAVDQDGTVYVTDIGRRQVLLYDQQGKLVDTIGRKDEMRPCGICLAGDKLYVTDMTNHCVRVYNKSTRELLLTVPRGPATNDQARLFSPTNVAVDRDGRIYVSDSGGFAAKIYDAQGNHLLTIGELGAMPGQFTLPKGIGVDHEGRVYVVDAAVPVVQVFDHEGRLLMMFGEPKSSGEAGLYLPAALTIDYNDLSYFQKYVAPGYKLEYLILLTNQAGPHKVSVYGFIQKI